MRNRVCGEAGVGCFWIHRLQLIFAGCMHAICELFLDTN